METNHVTQSIELETGRQEEVTGKLHHGVIENLLNLFEGIGNAPLKQYKRETNKK